MLLTRLERLSFAWGFLAILSISQPFVGCTYGAKIIVWQDEGDKVIRRANIDGSNVVDIIHTQFSGTGLAVDFVQGKVYWTSAGGGQSIQRVNLDGTGFEKLVTSGLMVPEGIALDLISGKMYWADQGPSKICRANLDGTNVEVLVTAGTTHPHDVALDLAGNKMYWTDSHTNKIQRANLDGTRVEDIAILNPTPGTPSPRGIALDDVHDKVYWNAQGYGLIQRSDLDGKNVEPLVNVPGWNGPDGIALDLKAGKMYWTGLNKVLKIQRSNLDGTKVKDVITTGLKIPRGIDVGVMPRPMARNARMTHLPIAVDLRAVRKQFIAKIRRGETSLPPNDSVPMVDRLRQVDREAVESWIRSKPVGTIGRLPDFYVRVWHVVDSDDVIVGEKEDNCFWVSGFSTDEMVDHQETRIRSVVVRIGTKTYQTASGSKTVRSINSLDESNEDKAGSTP